MEMRDVARKIGLTRKQFKVYSAWYAGETQQQIAERFSMRQSRVSECIARAIARVPSLPRRECTGRRRTLVFSQMRRKAATPGMNIDTL